MHKTSLLVALFLQTFFYAEKFNGSNALFEKSAQKLNIFIFANFTKTRGKWIRNEDTKWYYKVHGIKWELKK